MKAFNIAHPSYPSSAEGAGRDGSPNRPIILWGQTMAPHEIPQPFGRSHSARRRSQGRPGGPSLPIEAPKALNRYHPSAFGRTSEGAPPIAVILSEVFGAKDLSSEAKSPLVSTTNEACRSSLSQNIAGQTFMRFFRQAHDRLFAAFRMTRSIGCQRNCAQVSTLSE